MAGLGNLLRVLGQRGVQSGLGGQDQALALLWGHSGVLVSAGDRSDPSDRYLAYSRHSLWVILSALSHAPEVRSALERLWLM